MDNEGETLNETITSVDDSIRAALAEMKNEPKALEPEDIVEEDEPEDPEDLSELEDIEDPEDLSLAAPTSWKKEEQEYFASIPKEAQAVILRREKEASDGLSRLGSEKADIEKRYSTYQQLADKYSPAILAQNPNANVVDIIDQTMNFILMAQQNPQWGVQALAQHLGVDLDGLEDVHSAPQQDWRQEFQQFQNQVSQQIRTYDEQRQKTAFDALVNSFTSQKSEDGSPKYPHYEQLQPAILSVLRTPGLVPDGTPLERLTVAYGKALRMDDNLWQEHLKALKAKEKTEKTKRVAKAKEASSAVESGAAEATVPLKKGLTVDESIQEALKRMKGA